MMSKAEIRELIREVVDEAVPRALVRCGFEVDEPKDVRRDLTFLRDLRGATDAAKRHGLFVVLGTLIAAGAGLLWIGLRSKILGGP